MRLAAIGVVVVALTFAAPAAAQTLKRSPVEPQPQAAVGPRYEPRASFLAHTICDGLDALIDDYERLLAVDPLTTGHDLQMLYWASLTGELAFLTTLIEDARVQDPGFQCYAWDFSPPEPGRR